MSAFDVRYAHIHPKSLKGRLIRNPNYGGPSVGPFGWTWREELSKHGKEGFQTALRESVRTSGILNPILVWAFPEGRFLTFGGSRVRAALEEGLTEVPAIINDYTGEFAQCPLVTPENVADFFTDPPRDTTFGDRGFDYHYNLERARRQNHDPAGFAWLGEERPDWIDREFPWLKEG